jgi:hypothetical protein
LVSTDRRNTKQQQRRQKQQQQQQQHEQQQQQLPMPPGHARLRASPLASTLTFMEMPRDCQAMVIEQLTFTSFRIGSIFV